jgi:adenine-specific DNA-methyltransferase
MLKFKREMLKKFIEEQLPKIIEDTFAKYFPTQTQEEEKMKLQVLDDIYNFFSQYYKEGDLIPHYYNADKKDKDVALHWANEGQYFVKRGLIFRDHSFALKNDKCNKVLLKIVSAEEEIGSNKELKERFFLLDDKNSIELKDKTLIIRFQYREPTKEEIAYYEIQSGTTIQKQKKINSKIYEKIIESVDPDISAALQKQDKNGKPLLLSHISKFAVKRAKDYFIHKDLKGFLTNQLDDFIKSKLIQDIFTEENDTKIE